MAATLIVRGGGDLASGVIYRLARVGLRVVVTELPQPLAVRRLVAFGEAVYSGSMVVEGIQARLAQNTQEARECLEQGTVPVMIDPDCTLCEEIEPLAVIDARMTKLPPDSGRELAAMVIGMGPGFSAGENCDAVIETVRGHTLGRVIWDGSAQSDTGEPDHVSGYKNERVLRAPAEGVFTARVKIGDVVEAGRLIAEVGEKPVTAPFKGAVRGLIQSGLRVPQGLKIGDLDPRADPALCALISDKALAVGGGVLEALLARPKIRARLWE